MELRGLSLSPVWAASGVQGFFGEGYWYHGPFRLRRNLRSVTFVSKTSTLEARLNTKLAPGGNMPLELDLITPKEFFPKCIFVDPVNALTINAVGLSGPGLCKLLHERRWQDRHDPFQVSVMSVKPTLFERQQELTQMVLLLGEHFPSVKSSSKSAGSRFILQLNVSCPNAGQGASPHWEDMIAEAEHGASLALTYGWVFVVKVNQLTPAWVIARLGEFADAIVIGNTLPFGELPEEISWKALFPSGSPLEWRNLPTPGKGGLSGPLLLPLNLRLVSQARDLGTKCHLNVGSVFHPSDVARVKRAGGNSISVGTVCMHRPWRVPAIIDEARKAFD